MGNKGSIFIKFFKKHSDIILHYCPLVLDKTHLETIQNRGFIAFAWQEGIKNLHPCERRFQPNLSYSSNVLKSKSSNVGLHGTLSENESSKALSLLPQLLIPSNNLAINLHLLHVITSLWGLAMLWKMLVFLPPSLIMALTLCLHAISSIVNKFATLRQMLALLSSYIDILPSPPSLSVSLRRHLLLNVSTPNLTLFHYLIIVLICTDLFQPCN